MSIRFFCHTLSKPVVTMIQRMANKSSLFGQTTANMNWSVLSCLCLMVFSHSFCHGFTVRLPSQGPCCDTLVSRNNFTSKGNTRISRYMSWNPDATADEDFDKEDSDDDFEAVSLPDDRETALSAEELSDMTVPQLKQQLRLRNLKVSGSKSELMKRLLKYSGTYVPEEEAVKDEKFADVSEYLDPSEVGAATKSIPIGERKDIKNTLDDDEDEDSPYTEVWGADARIIDDYQEKSIVVDSISRTVVEFTGSNKTAVRAYVAASRDALKPFLRQSNTAAQKSPEKRLFEIQSKREEADKRPDDFGDIGDVDDEGRAFFKDPPHRDYSDWGKYTATGAQLSAEEVQGVLLLSDIYGMENKDTQALADKIAFECQPIIVMVPDLFDGKPWVGPTNQQNEDGLSYEEWRSLHDDLRVSVNIRAAAACLRERYAVSCVVVWGNGFGGGRALEAAAGWFPKGNIHDVDGSIGPAAVDPMAVVVWYPTRYNADDLFGKSKKSYCSGTSTMAVMGVFAEKDTISGATRADAAKLKSLLSEDNRVIDYMVKVFPDQDHGFAHRGLSTPPETDPYDQFVNKEFGGAGRLSLGDGDAEVACLLSTAFMETYSRVFLPTAITPICSDPSESEWQMLEMPDLSKYRDRDIREEIDEAVANFVGVEFEPPGPGEGDETKEPSLEVL